MYYQYFAFVYQNVNMLPFTPSDLVWINYTIPLNHVVCLFGMFLNIHNSSLLNSSSSFFWSKPSALAVSFASFISVLKLQFAVMDTKVYFDSMPGHAHELKWLKESNLWIHTWTYPMRFFAFMPRLVNVSCKMRGNIRRNYCPDGKSRGKPRLKLHDVRKKTHLL